MVFVEWVVVLFLVVMFWDWVNLLVIVDFFGLGSVELMVNGFFGMLIGDVRMSLLRWLGYLSV